MIAGYLLIGMIAGFSAVTAALLSGASFWSALLLYPIVGSASLLLVAVFTVWGNVLDLRRASGDDSLEGGSGEDGRTRERYRYGRRGQ